MKLFIEIVFDFEMSVREKCILFSKIESENCYLKSGIEFILLKFTTR
jgi:hypothetical protein